MDNETLEYARRLQEELSNPALMERQYDESDLNGAGGRKGKDDMCRQILFRGKRIDNGEWVEGDLSRCIVVGETHIRRIEDNLSTTTNRIDTETVCQYTGVTDKNGRKIFEGDIVIVNHADGQGDCTEKTEVSWDEKNASFSPWNWQYQCDGCDLYCEIQSIEVIGNIFDNPEQVEKSAG